MPSSEKKILLMKLFNEAKDFMDEYLQHDLENVINYNDPGLQDLLYWLAVILRDLMVITKKLREHYEEDFDGGGMSLILNQLLEKIEELWPENLRTNNKE